MPCGWRAPTRSSRFATNKQLAAVFAGRRQIYGRTGRLQARTGCATIAVMQQSGIVETAFIRDKEVGAPRPGAYNGRDLTLAELRTEAGQERNSIFGNPGLAVVNEMNALCPVCVTVYGS